MEIKERKRSNYKFYKQLGDTILAYRGRRGMSRQIMLDRMQELGSKRVTTNSIYYWEIGYSRLAVDDLVIVAEVLGVAVETLLYEAIECLFTVDTPEDEDVAR